MIKEFLMLFKYELKMQTPFLRKKAKGDFLGNAFTMLIGVGLIVAAFFFLAQIMRNYLNVEINKIAEPLERAKEMLVLLYLIILGIVTIFTLERTRKVFTDDKDKLIFLRLPLRRRNVFLSKFVVIFLHSFVLGSIFIITINIILATMVTLTLQVWLAMLGVCLFMPIASMLLVALLIVPYILLIEFFADKYLALFISFTLLLAGAFILYSQLLSVVQTLLTTGSIRFMFNEKFVKGLQGIYAYAYPINSMVAIMFESNAWMHWLILIGFSLVASFIVLLVSKVLYRITLYRQQRDSGKPHKARKGNRQNVVISLVKKEFLCVYREPKHVFSYLSIAMAMPIMVYCSFTLFETLIYNTLGIRVNYALALSVILLFGVLTNTFCATNVSRDGYGILKLKSLPLRVSRIFGAKVLFCGVISSLALIASCVVLMATNSIKVYEGFICMVIGLAFTFAQIFVATRIDLNNAHISMQGMEVEDHSNKTLSKVMLIGIVLTMIASAICIFFAFFANGIGVVKNPELASLCVYLLPAVIGLLYLGLGYVYFRVNIKKSFENLSIQ